MFISKLLDLRCRNEGKWTYYALDVETISKTQQFFCAITSDKVNCICKEDADSCKGCSVDEA